MSGIFSRIIAREIPSYKIYEDEKHYAFLDINPLAIGHTLVIPKLETDYLFDLSETEYLNLWGCVKKIEKGLKKVVNCKRIGIAVVGLEIPHAHVHLVPLNNVSDINFEKPKLLLPKNEMELISQKIRQAI